ncbi:Hypothetical predicted protein [Lecanosticta acicola]|uniref:Uncharacterized protein n=1 Tax=Lecanosticta acicola TaxID=111012 RepID=A0AAI8Z637_9PEZI|nr:Hypothetical predicted protein [Lecanosticta acicola]
MSNCFPASGPNEPAQLRVLQSPAMTPGAEGGYYTRGGKAPVSPPPAKAQSPRFWQRRRHEKGHGRETTYTPIDTGALIGPMSPPVGAKDEPLNIVILGASFGGLSCAHHFLDYTIERLGISSAAPIIA